MILSGPPTCTLTKQIEKLTTLKVFGFLFAFFLRMERDYCTQHNFTVSRRKIVWNTVEYILQLIIQMTYFGSTVEGVLSVLSIISQFGDVKLFERQLNIF